MSTASPIPPLFRALVDDAALFPPGNAPMPVAVAEHRRHREAPYTDLVGPLLLPAARWGELLESLGAAPGGTAATGTAATGTAAAGTAAAGAGAVGRGGPREAGPVPLDIGLIGPVDQLAEVAAAALAEPRVVLRQLECPIGAEPDPVGAVADVAQRLDAVAGESVRRFIELPRGPRLLDAVDAVVASRGVEAKLRTGGLAAEAFPSEPELAAFVDRCIERDQPFKLTAGLHHALRHTDPSTGFEHHGYLNVLAAVCLGALPDPPLVGTEQALAGRTAGPLVETVRARLAVGERRPWFASYGSCSVAEPLTDLAELGLLDGDLLSYLPASRKAPA